MSKKKSNKELLVNENIALNINELNNMEDYISKILSEESFNRINILQNNENIRTNNLSSINLDNNNALNTNYEFISIDFDSLSPYKNLISENEFFKIVQFKNGKISNSTGLYQESLYGHYIEAKENQDEGYISDVLNKAVIFQNNLNYVKTLTKDTSFMEEWKKDFGQLSPINDFKHSGSLRKINIIKERII